MFCAWLILFATLGAQNELLRPLYLLKALPTFDAMLCRDVIVGITIFTDNGLRKAINWRL